MPTQRRTEKTRREPEQAARSGRTPPPLPAAGREAALAIPLWPVKFAILALAVLLIYSPVCNPTLPADWLWDDDQLLTANLTVQHKVSPDPNVAPDHLGTLVKLWWNPDGADFFPLSYTALWAQWYFFQMDPRTGGPVQPGGPPAVPWPTGFHVVTVLLHLLGSLALWRLFTVMKMPGAWLGALIWAVHPVCVESVAWVSELKNTLSLPLFLLAAINYIHFDDMIEQGITDDETPAVARYVAALVLFLFAMFAKTSVVAMPVVILLYAWWKRNTISARDLVCAAPFFLISLGLGYQTYRYQNDRAIGDETIVVPALVGDGSANYRDGGVKIDSRTVRISAPDGTPIYVGPLQTDADVERVPAAWRQRARDAKNTRRDKARFRAFDDGRVELIDSPENKTVRISARDGRPIHEGPLRTDADLEQVPEAWRRRVRAVDRGIGLPSAKGWLSRGAIAGTSVLFYIETIFCPVNLLPIYPRWDIDLLDVAQFSQATEMLGYLVPIPVILAVLAWFWARRDTWGRHALFACGFFLLMVAPVLGFFTISYMRITWAADHFIYMPMIAIVGLVAAGVATWYERVAEDVRALIMTGTAVVVAVLAFLSLNYAACWVNEDALWTHTLAHNSNAWQAHNRLGAKKFSRGHVESLPPESGLRPEVDIEASRIGRGTQIKNLGAFYHFSWSTHLRPDLGETHNNLGTAWSARAQMAAQQGNKAVADACMSKAVEQFAEACRVTPHVPAIHVNLANALAAAGRFDEAAAKYRDLLQKEPGNPALINNYGVALYKSGRKEEAIVQFRKALAIAPNLKDAQESLAVALGERPDPSAQPPQPDAGPAPPPGAPAPPPPLNLQPPKSPTLGPTIQ